MIPMLEYAKRRKTLMEKIDKNGIIIIPSASEIKRSNDVVYPFRQNSDFYYLTGFEEPDAVLVLIPSDANRYILFNRVRNREMEIWDGPRAGQKGACENFKADLAFPIADFEKMLPDLIAQKNAIYYPVGRHSELDAQLIECVNQMRTKVRTGLHPPQEFIDVTMFIHEMRLFKSPNEIAVIQKAIDISEKAHVNAMKICQPGLYEYQLEAAFQYIFMNDGARYPAYSPIVGSGKNSCILHYVENNKKIEKGEVILIDAGAEYQNYAADITRTFPVSGRFSEEQKAIYELVLASQLAAIDSIKPKSSWNKTQEIVIKVITEGLVDLGILKGKVNDLIEKKAYFPFYMHRAGHWLGLDVHDVGQYQIKNKWRNLEKGMVFTVEPGIYISDDIPGVHKRWHHIGVRIEDNVLVTEKGCNVLSKNIPKKIDDIYAVMRQ